MKKRLSKGLIFGSVALAGGICGRLIYRQYHSDMSLAYQRISRGGKRIETACGPIQYAEFGEGAPMLIVHGKVGLGLALAFTLFLIPFWWQGGAIANLVLAVPLLWLLRYDYPRSILEIFREKRTQSQPQSTSEA